MLKLLTPMVLPVLTLVCLQTASANDYFVEAVVFAWNDRAQSNNAERWKIAGREPAAMPGRVRQQTDNPSAASEKRLLDQAISRLTGSGDASLVMHQAWTQFRAGRDGSPQVAFKVTDAGLPEAELSGWIRVYESSLLYLEVDLALFDPNAIAQTFASDSRFLDRPDAGSDPGGAPTDTANPSVQNRGGVTVTTDAQGNVSFSNRETGNDGSGLANSAYLNTAPGLTYRIDERRRVKFNEIHYIDHPQFGVLFTISRNESG